MKFEVIGWTYYEDDYPVHEGDEESVFRAVVKAVREGGYKFGGNSHDSALSGVPVLNDGTMACFSWRVWGGVMAEALQLPDEDGMAYTAWYMDNREVLLGLPRREIVLPPRGVDKTKIVPREALAEEFEMHLVPAAFEAVVSGKKTAEIRRPDEKRLLVCKDDFIRFICGEKTCRVRVTGVESEQTATLFGKRKIETEGDRIAAKRAAELIACARFEGYETAEKLYEFFRTVYPEDTQYALIFKIALCKEA